ARAVRLVCRIPSIARAGGRRDCARKRQVRRFGRCSRGGQNHRSLARRTVVKIALLLLFALPLTAQPTVKLSVRGRGSFDLPLERYVAAVLAGEAAEFRSTEALKAMSVAARTYAVRLRGRHAAEGFDFCDTTHCQHIDLTGVSSKFESVASG